MNIFVYSDESGVFDNIHNSTYVYGGVIFLDKNQRDDCNRKYIHAEHCVRSAGKYTGELKASGISNAHKYKLFRSLNSCIKFGAIVEEKKVHNRIFNSKKDKQRYLDYVYKIALKNAFQNLIDDGKIVPEEVEGLYVFADEHTTATNGRYELGESLIQEFKNGTYNFNWTTYFPPIFKNIKTVEVTYKDSCKSPLIRAADIVANNIYHRAISKKEISSKNLYIKFFP